MLVLLPFRVKCHLALRPVQNGQKAEDTVCALERETADWKQPANK